MKRGNDYFQVTYLKCKTCGKFYEDDTEHICSSQYASKSQKSKETAHKIKDMISRKVFGKPYSGVDNPTLYQYYESVLKISKLNLKIRSRYPWNTNDCDSILAEAERILNSKWK